MLQEPSTVKHYPLVLKHESHTKLCNDVGLGSIRIALGDCHPFEGLRMAYSPPEKREAKGVWLQAI